MNSFGKHKRKSHKRKSRSRKSHKRSRKSHKRSRKSHKRSRKSHKRKSRSRKSHKRSKRREMKRYRPERGCTRQSTKKYSTRPSPPYPANLCRGRVMTGNDGNIYKSSSAKNTGRVYYRWKKI